SSCTCRGRGVRPRGGSARAAGPAARPRRERSPPANAPARSSPAVPPPPPGRQGRAGGGAPALARLSEDTGCLPPTGVSTQPTNSRGAMLDDESWERIARYALGECSAAEAVETRAWIEADPERAALAEELIRLADAGPTAIWDARRAWQRFSATLDADTVQPIPSRSAAQATPSGVLPYRAARRRRAGRRAWLVAAAAAAVLLASSAVTWRLTRGSAPAAVAAAEDLRTVATQPRQTAEVYL